MHSHAFVDELEDFAWHVKRRIAGIGMIKNVASDAWSGIAGMKAKERKAALDLIALSGKIDNVTIDKTDYCCMENVNAVLLEKPGEHDGIFETIKRFAALNDCEKIVMPEGKTYDR